MTTKAEGHFASVDRWREDARKWKIKTALEALPMTTGGDWWVDDRGELLSDPSGTHKLGREVGGYSTLWAKSNRRVIAASRELAEEVLLLRLAIRAADASLREKECRSLTDGLSESDPSFKVLNQTISEER